MNAPHPLPHTRTRTLKFPSAASAAKHVATEIDKLIRARNAAGKPTTNAWVAKVDAATGALGDWQTAKEAGLPIELPEARSSAAVAVASLARHRDLRLEVDSASGLLAAELVYALEQEWAVTLEDLLQRRTMVGLRPDFGLAAAEGATLALERLGIARIDGAPVELRWYTKQGSSPGSAVLYLHGGGMICGSLDIYDSVLRNSVSKSGVPMLTVEYRLAPEHPHPAPLQDAVKAYRWLLAQGLSAGHLMIAGDSAGGGGRGGGTAARRAGQRPVAGTDGGGPRSHLGGAEGGDCVFGG